MTCKRGDIALVLFPDSNLRSAKRRPVVVIQDDDLNTGISQILVAMISSNPARAGHPSRVRVVVSTEEGRQTGLKIDSIIMTDNLATIREELFEIVIGRMPNMEDIDAALRHTFGL